MQDAAFKKTARQSKQQQFTYTYTRIRGRKLVSKVSLQFRSAPARSRLFAYLVTNSAGNRLTTALRLKTRQVRLACGPLALCRSLRESRVRDQ